MALRDSTPSVGQCLLSISLENFGILPPSRLLFMIYLQEMMCHAESRAAVRDTVAGTRVLYRRLSRDTLQTVEDALSLQLREPDHCPASVPLS